MGRTALLLVMGLGMAMGVISYNISGTTQRALENNYTYYKYMYARNLARSAIYSALRTFDRGEDVKTALTPFGGGSYRIVSLRTSAPPGDTVWITSQGSFADTNYNIYATLFRTTKPFPGVNAAIGIRASPVTFSMNGQPEVNGFNHNESGTAQVGWGNVPGVAVMNSTDSSTVYAAELGTPGDNIKGPIEVKVDTTTANPAEYITEYLSSAHFYLTAGQYSAMTFGSASNPVIVVCDAPDDPNYKVKFTGNTKGWGILAVRGSLEIAGNFEWYGLVVCFGESNTVDFGGSGTPKIVGGLIVAQPGAGAAKLTLKGTGSSGKVLYSSAALNKAKNIGKLRYYSVIDWWEGLEDAPIRRN